MTFNIRDKEFKISFVNNYIREQYTEMLNLADELADLPDVVDEIVEDDTKNKMQKRRELRDLKKEQRRLVREIAEIRDDMLNELLTTNGYDYEREWWKRKTDVNDINRFVLDSIQKDVNADEASKKK